MTSSVAIPLLEPKFEPAADRKLPELTQLFDRDWVWSAFRLQSIVSEYGPPQRFRVCQFAHSPGRSALVRYEAHWRAGTYVAPQHFVARLDKNGSSEFFIYPEDGPLPGLRAAADPERALDLANEFVLTVPGRRARVQLITYRPGYRAVLRHRFGRVKLYARVARPVELPRLLDAYEIVKSSGFVVPNLAGYWTDGGVMWLSEIRGVNLRRRIRQGDMPDPSLLLNGLVGLWSRPLDSRAGRPMRLAGAFRSARRSFRHHLRDYYGALRILNEAEAALAPFARSWAPTGSAHNDFYDDQLLMLADGRVALVDFEEAGPGEPMLDIGNFLAHLLWSAKFSKPKSAQASLRYYEALRLAALERFAWDARSLSFREAICLFRVCTNVIRHPREHWLARLESGLAMVNALLSSGAMSL